MRVKRSTHIWVSSAGKERDQGLLREEDEKGMTEERKGLGEALHVFVEDTAMKILVCDGHMQVPEMSEPVGDHPALAEFITLPQTVEQRVDEFSLALQYQFTFFRGQALCIFILFLLIKADTSFVVFPLLVVLFFNLLVQKSRSRPSRPSRSPALLGPASNPPYLPN